MKECINTSACAIVIKKVDNELLHCKVYITIKLQRYYTGEEYYDISYTYEYNDVKCKYLNPFFNNWDDSEGVIVKRNSMTDKMVEYLMMDEDVLGQQTGETCPQEYKVGIMKGLALLWD